MKRKTFLKTLMATLPVTTMGMSLNTLNNFLSDNGNASSKMPVLFLGHGSPMNAIEENEFVQGFRKVSSEIQIPKAILCISAHWETKGTKVTAMKQPKTIHDFGGFPKALYDIEYPAPGHPELAKETKNILQPSEAILDESWGLDHGAWTVLRHMYPEANIPVVQLSLDYGKTPMQHYELAQQLKKLRHKGILIVGSGNVVHNLGMVAWNKLNTDFGYDWAHEASEKIKTFIQNGNHKELINYKRLGKAFDLAIPSPDHYLPMLYALALQDKEDEVSIFNDKHLGGSLSMTSVKITK